MTTVGLEHDESFVEEYCHMFEGEDKTAVALICRHPKPIGYDYIPTDYYSMSYCDCYGDPEFIGRMLLDNFSQGDDSGKEDSAEHIVGCGDVKNYHTGDFYRSEFWYDIQDYDNRPRMTIGKLNCKFIYYYDYENGYWQISDDQGVTYVKLEDYMKEIKILPELIAQAETSVGKFNRIYKIGDVYEVYAHGVKQLSSSNLEQAYIEFGKSCEEK